MGLDSCLEKWTMVEEKFIHLPKRWGETSVQTLESVHELYRDNPNTKLPCVLIDNVRRHQAYK